MEFQQFDHPEEIVLTYRQADSAEPVVLRYERELPKRMCRAAQRPAYTAVFPGEMKPGSGRRTKLMAGLLLLAALICVGLGLWYAVRSVPEAPPQESDGNNAGQIPDDFYHYWDDNPADAGEAETAIQRYDASKDGVALTLSPGAQGAAALTAGEIYEQVRPAVVTVLGTTETGYNVGTGVIFHSDGYLITNYHVISGCGGCLVWVTDEYGVDQEYPALLVGGDEDQDLAVLKIAATGLPVAQFGVSDELSVGDKVYAIGNPLGLELRSTLTDGIISAINRDVDVNGFTMTLLQTNAALNSGNSGGPLINQYGQVVGINTIKMMSGYDNTIEGLGFAIPTSFAGRWVNEILATGKIEPQPILGLSINRIPITLPDGASALEVAEVTAGLSGDRAGIRVGDCILAFNGQTVRSTEEILAIRRQLHVGQEVSMQIWRDGEYLDIAIVMMANNR